MENYKKITMLTQNKNQLIEEYNASNSCYSTTLGSQISQQTGDLKNHIEADISQQSTQKFGVDESKIENNYKNIGDNLGFLTCFGNEDVQNDDSFELQLKSYQNNVDSSFNYDNSKYKFDQKVLTDEENGKMEQNQNFQIQLTNSEQTNVFAKQDLLPQYTNFEFQEEQMPSNQFLYNYYSFEEDCLFDEIFYQQNYQNKFFIQQHDQETQNDNKIFANNHFEMISNYNQIQINGQNTNNNYQKAQIDLITPAYQQKPLIQLNQLQQDLQQLQNQQEIQNEDTLEEYTAPIQKKIKKTRNRKRQQNIICEDKCQETKNIANNIFKFLFQQMNQLNIEIQYPKQGYISIKEFNNILIIKLETLTKENQSLFKKTLLQIINASLMKKATNSKNYKTHFKILKYKVGLEVMIQNPGQFKSIKEASDYAISEYQK